MRLTTSLLEDGPMAALSLRERKLVGKSTPLTFARLREVMHYNPVTGEFRWISRQHGREKTVGWTQKYKGCQRRMVCIDYKIFMLHRIAWLWMTGKWPEELIDHINRNPMDNRWKNLREANHSQNAYNMPIRKDNISGVKGVCWNKKAKKWKVDLLCDTKEQAMQIAALHRKLIGAFADTLPKRKMGDQF